MTKIHITEIGLYETPYKTIKKFKHTGTLRLETSLFNFNNQDGLEILMEICKRIDCNFPEVLDAINRTVR